MVELVDTTDLKSVGGPSREGSSPSFATIINLIVMKNCKKELDKRFVWSPEEISLLRKHWKNHDQKQLKEKFFPNKTVEQVRSRKMYDGLKGRRIWSEEEREILLNHGKDYDMREMHEKFLPNKTPLQISNMRKYFGIKRGGKKSRCNI